jgi:outer membrane lipoprotein SlyB
MGKMNGLKYIPRRMCGGLAGLGLISLLTACAGGAPPQTAPTGLLRLGTVVSVRPARFDGDDSTARKILATLNVSAPTAQDAVELVIRQQDNSVVTVVQPVGPGQPDFISGEHVQIVETANTVVLPQ